MKELKFRAWLKNYNCYADVLGFEQGRLFVQFQSGERAQHRLYVPIEDCVLEQYTGIKDKNGKDIYEGDIVKARWLRAKNARFDTSGEVKFNDGWFYIYDDPDAQDRLGVPIHNCYDMEVIGNVHENADLLEEE